MADNPDDIDTDRVPRIEDPVDVMLEAELELRRTADLLHEHARKIERVQRRLIAARQGKPFPS